jgi:hypothetical protein
MISLIQELRISRPPLNETVLGVFDFAKITAGARIIGELQKP